MARLSIHAITPAVSSIQTDGDADPTIQGRVDSLVEDMRRSFEERLEQLKRSSAGGSDPTGSAQ